jgi:hypothetical protein
MIQLDGEDPGKSYEDSIMLHLQNEDTGYFVESEVSIIICYMERISRSSMKRWRELNALTREYWSSL